MKLNIIIGVSTVLGMIVVGGKAVMVDGHRKDLGVYSEIATPSVTPPGGVEERIRVLDSSTANAALDEAILERDVNMIQIGLKSRSLFVKIRAAETLAEVGGDSSVCPLVEALEFNQGLIGGGTEVQILQNQFSQALVVTLEKLTSMKFKVSDRIADKLISSYTPFSPEEMKEIISKTQKWCDPPKRQF